MKNEINVDVIVVMEAKYRINLLFRNTDIKNSRKIQKNNLLIDKMK